MPRIPSIPQQLMLSCCQPPRPPVPDWETLEEATRTAVRAVLARVIERLATANREGASMSEAGIEATQLRRRAFIYVRSRA